MKVTYNWLKDYVDIDIKPNVLAEKLTMAGLEVVSLEKSGNDWVMEIEVTPNRPDCLGIIGIARETAAITKKTLKLPKTCLPQAKKEEQSDLSIEIQDKSNCPRYTGRVITDVKIGPSPEWLKRRLKQVGVRPVNNVVDITNYCLFEWGQPLHAFDYDRLNGEGIIVRPPKKKETIVTIDNVSRALDNNMLVIADQKRAVAIAGVIGGKDTEVTSQTKNILLESAYFAPLSIRRTSRRLGITTESSYRFERGVDLEGVLTASDRAASLILEVAGGNLATKVRDVGKKCSKSREVVLRPLKVNQVLGISISPREIASILKRLQFKVHSGNKRFRVGIPCFREDITREIDLIEEIVRVYGYDRIPKTTAANLGVRGKEEEPERKIQALTRATLTALGFNEIITYSLIGEDLLGKSNLNEEDVAVIENPLSYDQKIMRASLIPGLLSVVARNLNKRVGDIRIFELGRVYLKPKKGSPRERTHVSLAITGSKKHDWRSRGLKADFFDLKGRVEVMLDKLGVTGYKIIAGSHPALSPGQSAHILVNKKIVGFIGEVSMPVVQAFDFPEKVYIAELIFDHLLKFVNLEKAFSAIPKYPSVLRDIAVVVRNDISSDQIVSLLAKSGEGLISSIKLFDKYSGKQIPQGNKGLAYSLEYRHHNKTLTDEEINQVHSKLCKELTRQLGAEIR